MIKWPLPLLVFSFTLGASAPLVFGWVGFAEPERFLSLGFLWLAFASLELCLYVLDRQIGSRK